MVFFLPDGQYLGCTVGCIRFHSCCAHHVRRMDIQGLCWLQTHEELLAEAALAFLLAPPLTLDPGNAGYGEGGDSGR